MHKLIIHVHSVSEVSRIFVKRCRRSCTKCVPLCTHAMSNVWPTSPVKSGFHFLLLGQESDHEGEGRVKHKLSKTMAIAIIESTDYIKHPDNSWVLFFLFKYWRWYKVIIHSELDILRKNTEVHTYYSMQWNINIGLFSFIFIYCPNNNSVLSTKSQNDGWIRIRHYVIIFKVNVLAENLFERTLRLRDLTIRWILHECT